VGEDLRAVQSEINSTIVEEWFRANEVLANKALPEFVRSISQEEKIHFMDLLFNENFNSIYNLTSELTGREVADEEVFEYLDVFRLAIPNSDRVHVLRRMKADQLLYCARWLTDEDTHLNRFKKRLADFQKENDPKSGDFDFDLFRSTLMAPNAIAENILSRAYDWTMDIPAIANVSGNIGYFNAVIDFDGTVRRTELLKRDGANYVLSLALRTFMVLKKLSPMVYLNEIFDDPSNKGKIGVDHIELTDIDGNKDSSNETILRPRYRGDIYINYAGKQQMFPHVSTKEILSSSENMYIQERIFEEGDWREKSIEVNKREFMKDKILIFGVTATAVYDLRVTPFQENFPGVETHANIVDNLIRNDFLLPNNLEKSIMPYILLAMGVALSLALGNLSATMSMLITAASLAGVYYIDKYLFFSKGTLTAVIFPLLLVFTIYVTLTFYRYVTEERKKKELRTTFAKYVSPQIVNEVLASPENLQLGGRKEVMTVFFSDIRGFTTISEKLDPEALSDLLNEYLTPMTEIVFANRGTLDKYMGDAVMAFFGAPISTATHADDACRCALQSIRKTIELQQVFRERNYPIIDIGIGLNTGEMSVGNMGSNIVRNYTVMGDAVNLGSRLEAINKEYGTRIIISEFTKNVISKDFVTREVDWVRVKGKLLPVRIFELIAEGSIDPSQEELLKYFCEGFHLYHEQQWKRSLSSFEQALQVNPQDYASKLYLERCQGYIIEPPPEEWDGVFTMKTK
jgi:adenylate cyclase